MKKAMATALVLILLVTMTAGCAKSSDNDIEMICRTDEISSEKLPQGDPATLRVMQFNLNNCTEGEKITEAAEEIRAQAPDVICIQELDWETKRSEHKRVIEELADALRMNYLFVPAMALDGGMYGVGILSKYHIEETERIPLETEKGEDARVLGRARISLGGEKIDIFTTQLSRESDESRYKQLKLLNDFIVNPVGDDVERDFENIVICGDFGVKSYGEYDTVERVKAVNNAASGYATMLPDESEEGVFSGIDNIMISENGEISSGKMIETAVSDHNMLAADISFGK